MTRRKLKYPRALVGALVALFAGAVLWLTVETPVPHDLEPPADPRRAPEPESTVRPRRTPEAPPPAGLGAPPVPNPSVPTARGPDPVSADDIESLRSRALTMPVQGVAPEHLIPGFDQPRGAGHHEAIDIMAPRGTPVLAVEDGLVAKLFNSKRGGLTIYQFDPLQRYAYYYAHLDQYAHDLDEGDRVDRGEVIGYVGSTGNAGPAGPHLHFAIFKLGAERRWWEGTPIDPYAVLHQ